MDVDRRRPKELGVSSKIVFECSMGDWNNTTSLSAKFQPGSEEDQIMSANVEALFNAHNTAYHSGKATLGVRNVVKPIPPKED